ncbi:MAG TPA: hypothetical protein VNR70_14420 [Steroidobacteraceae bacterium]|nr:hypothetical protein [Steroidobacteraceae bacterium]
MIRFVFLMLLTVTVHAAESTVDIDTAAKIYQAAAIREQVRASLGAMPEHIRQLFEADSSAKLSDQQLAAVSAAAVRGFRIDVFEVPALQAFANHLDTATVNKTEAFLTSDLGKRMVTADVALATLGESNIDKVMTGQITAPSTPKRDAIVDKLERATHSTESTVQIFLSMGQAVAVGTAIGSGMDTVAVGERAHKSGEASRAGLEDNMRLPMRRFLAYGYRDLSDSDLKHLLSFMESTPGKRYVTAYNASMGAGFDAMGRRTGEQLGESLRELALAQMLPPAQTIPPSIAAPPPVLPHSTKPPESPAPAVPATPQ